MPRRAHPQGHPPGPPAGGGYGGGYGGAPAPEWRVGDAVSFGWRTFKANLGPILLAMLVLFIVNGAFQGLSSVFGDNVVLTLVFGVLGWVVSTVLSAGVIRGALDLTEGRGIRRSRGITDDERDGGPDRRRGAD